MDKSKRKFFKMLTIAPLLTILPFNLDKKIKLSDNPKKDILEIYDSKGKLRIRIDSNELK